MASTASVASSVTGDIVRPENLAALLEEVAKEATKPGITTPANALVSTLRRFHFWPALQVKKFFDDSGLTLLHNTYKRIDVDHFQALYDEARSVVLDLAAPAGKNVVVTFAQNIPRRMTIGQYKQSMEPGDSCTLSYEGTVITVYHHNDKWFFGTSTCPTVDSSRYFHPTKTHGAMFDEAIARVMKTEAPCAEKGILSGDLRNQFAERLDKTKAYAFLLVHHENKHIMDYTEEFGAEYAEILQISTRDRETLEEATDPAALVVAAPLKFETSEDAITYIEASAAGTPAYGIFVTRADGSLLKVSSDQIVRREEVDLGNANPWQNMLHVYMLRMPDYHIKDYLAEFKQPYTLPINSHGAKLTPTYVIHMAMCAMCDILYGAYRASTYYNMTTKRYRITRVVDEALSPNIKFHLAQLRALQITHHTHKPLNTTAIMSYLCHHNTMKNMRLLFEHIATTPENYPLSFESMECVRLLNQQLKQ
jgi:hypothetical protein